MQRLANQSPIGGYLPSVVAIALFLGTLAFNAFTYAALAAHAQIGSAFRTAIDNDSPVIEAYVMLGDLLRGVPGLANLGDATANAAAEPLVDRIKPFPRGASAVFFGSAQSAAHGRMLWTHRLLPFLLVLAGVLWWRRQKPVHMRQRLRA
ncbi:MAG TPA: hypothetical protein VN259_13135 [Xanthomonadales bacterium]|nr:hypothetical protein [Xanthomonadales bacterium]